jgi:hypothetical protein
MAKFNTGKAVDEIAQWQAKRDRLAIAVDVMETEIAKKKEKLLGRMKKSDLDGARGRFGQASVVEDDVPTMEDFAKVWAYARKKNAPDLFQKRLSSTAVRERWAEGKAIPGVGKFHRVVLTVCPVKKR